MVLCQTRHELEMRTVTMLERKPSEMVINSEKTTEDKGTLEKATEA